MDGVFLYSATPGDESHDTANVSADVLYIRCWKPILHISSDQLLLAEVYNFKILQIVRFKVPVGAGSRTVQIFLQLCGNLYAHKQSLLHLRHLLFSPWPRTLSYRHPNNHKRQGCETIVQPQRTDWKKPGSGPTLYWISGLFRLGVKSVKAERNYFLTWQLNLAAPTDTPGRNRCRQMPLSPKPVSPAVLAFFQPQRLE